MHSEVRQVQKERLVFGLLQEGQSVLVPSRALKELQRLLGSADPCLATKNPATRLAIAIS